MKFGFNSGVKVYSHTNAHKRERDGHAYIDSHGHLRSQGKETRI